MSPLLRINPLAKDSESTRPLAKDSESADGFHEAQDRIAEAARCDDTSTSLAKDSESEHPLAKDSESADMVP